jgi:hypothetical protein
MLSGRVQYSSSSLTHQTYRVGFSRSLWDRGFCRLPFLQRFPCSWPSSGKLSERLRDRRSESREQVLTACTRAVTPAVTPDGRLIRGEIPLHQLLLRRPVHCTGYRHSRKRDGYSSRVLDTVVEAAPDCRQERVTTDDEARTQGSCCDLTAHVPQMRK